MLFKRFSKTKQNIGKKVCKFFIRLMKSWVEDNNIEIYLKQHEERSAVAERFIRVVKIKIYINMTSISKNIYIDKIGDIVNKYNNTYHRTIKMEPTDVSPNKYLDFEVESNDKDPKFKA